MHFIAKSLQLSAVILMTLYLWSLLVVIHMDSFFKVFTVVGELNSWLIILQLMTLA